MIFIWFHFIQLMLYWFVIDDQYLGTFFSFPFVFIPLSTSRCGFIEMYSFHVWVWTEWIGVMCKLVLLEILIYRTVKFSHCWLVSKLMYLQHVPSTRDLALTDYLTLYLLWFYCNVCFCVRARTEWMYFFG